MAVVPFISSSGDVLTVDPVIDPVSDSLIRIRFTLDESEWARIQDSDIFGAKTRRRFPEVLDGSGAVSVTVEGSRLALESPRGWQAEDFEIVSAMRKIENSEGSHMVGMLFASAPAWTQALNSLMEMGFIPGETVVIDQVAPLGDPISIQVAGYHLSLRLNEAQKVIVEEI